MWKGKCMDNVIELENNVTADGFRVVHLMSNVVIDSGALQTGFDAPAGVNFEARKEAGVYHLRATWPICGPIYINGEGWPMPRKFVMWHLSLVDSVKLALYEANKKYEDMFLERAEYAFIRKLPRGVENGVEVGNLMLFKAEWMVRQCVAVGFLYQ